MNTLDAVATRRSIRRFESRPVPRTLIEQVLAATAQAPSAKNAQAWRFVALQGESHQELVRIMQARANALKEVGLNIGSLEWTARSMSAATVTIVVFNVAPPPDIPEETHAAWNHVMLQSTGGAIQTMLLAAHDLGLGALWICDILYAACKVRQWLGREGESLVACVTLGYAAESPGARPRRPWQELTEWRG
jgi:nitroreductase